MPARKDLKRVMVIGSGPIIIGQAAEFDYAGTQACKALREEGLEVILVNSNPATIMTDTNMADRVYLEPLTVSCVAEILRKEQPDGLLPTLGGQTGLNLAFDLARAGVLDELGVELLGTPLQAIEKAEDRDRFKATMQSLGEPVPESAIVSSLAEAREFAEAIGYPVIIRPAYTLGGTGGGIAENEAQLMEIVRRGLRNSIIGQVLLERSVAGWKELEYEVIRDGADNCIVVCNMENIDPIGVHTGDSIVVAPSQTLTDFEYQMLRTASLRIIRELGIEGGCNVQFALSPKGDGYYVIEVNPRVSRSSALASKATGYPIAKVAAKIAVGLTLPEIRNPVTGKTTACFEPALDYVVSKIPRWPFDKFHGADRVLGTQMKATGEVMAIGRTFAESMLKAVRSLEIGGRGWATGPYGSMSEDELRRRLKRADDERLFLIAEGFKRGFSVSEIARDTGIDPFFLQSLERVVQFLKGLDAGEELGADRLRQAKELGISNEELAEWMGCSVEDVERKLQTLGISPCYKMVDTCAGEFAAQTPYYYSTYDSENESAVHTGKDRVIVLGSGPIRIGQGIEFDYASVHSVWAIQEAGMEAIIINNNPETVSTDFDTGDKLYFEPLTVEDVVHIASLERAKGVVVQFGGQTAINLAEPLAKRGIPILGTSVEAIDMAEDRDKFEKLMTRLGILQTEGATASSVPEAMGIANKLGFPLVVRPSYVLGGRAMEIVYDEQSLWEYMQTAVKVSPRHPVLLDRYIPGLEVEVDAICDGEMVVIPGIMEHIERAGVHSGDSLAVFPPQNLTPDLVDELVETTERIALALKVQGLINIQFVIHQGRVYVLEVNPRASRTVPYLSKVTGIPMVRLATLAMLGYKLRSFGYQPGLQPPPPFVAAKAPVFSFEKLAQVDPFLSPEMKSTGEVLGLGLTFGEAVAKALLAAGTALPEQGAVLFSLADKDKPEGVKLAKAYLKEGFKLFATLGTARWFQEQGLDVKVVGEEHPTDPAPVIEALRSGEIALAIITPTRGKLPGRYGFQIRRAAVESRVPCCTSLDTAGAVLAAVHVQRTGFGPPLSLTEYLELAGQRDRLENQRVTG